MRSPDVTHVESARGSYPVRLCEAGPSELAQELLELVPTGTMILVSDDNVAPRWTQPLLEHIRERGRRAHLVEFPAGEDSKSVDGIARIWDELLSIPVRREDTVVAIGGGVTGDLAGFAASTLLRGLSCVQVATSSLAMADAAIGGKTGINMPQGKNLVGCFHAPVAVILWTGALGTLPERAYRSGLAEVVKSALLDGEPALQQLEASAAALASRDPAALVDALVMSCRRKAQIVSADEVEQGERKKLNLGHTFAHAIENAMGYGAWTHGEAVAAGMVMAAELATDLLEAPAALKGRLQRLLQTLGLPDTPPQLSIAQWLNPISTDKKRRASGVDLILCKSPGDVYVVHQDLDWIRNWLTSSPWILPASKISSPARER